MDIKIFEVYSHHNLRKFFISRKRNLIRCSAEKTQQNLINRTQKVSVRTNVGSEKNVDENAGPL